MKTGSLTGMEPAEAAEPEADCIEAVVAVYFRADYSRYTKMANCKDSTLCCATDQRCRNNKEDFLLESIVEKRRLGAGRSSYGRRNPVPSH